MRHFTKLIGLTSLGAVLAIAPAYAGGQMGGRPMGHFVAHPGGHFVHHGGNFVHRGGNHVTFRHPGPTVYRSNAHGMAYHHPGYHHYGYRHPGWRHYGYYHPGYGYHRRGYGYYGYGPTVGLYYSAPTPEEDATAAMNGYPTDALGYPLYYYTGYPVGYDGGEYTPTGNGVIYNIPPTPLLPTGPKIIYLHKHAQASGHHHHMQIIRHGVVSDAD